MLDSQLAKTKLQRRIRFLAFSFTLLLTVVIVAAWIVAGQLIQPANRIVGDAPKDFPAEVVEFESESGAMLKGWYRAVENSRATIIL